MKVDKLVTTLSRKQLLENRANQPNKFNLRRGEIAAATLEVLAENGYAKTSLRDIAAKADFSLGTLHYYFENKVELISFCVRNYKRNFIDDINEIINGAPTYDALAEGFTNLFVHAIEVDSDAHRLWYDTRSQSMFDPSFREVVKELEDALLEMTTNLVRRVEKFTGQTHQTPDHQFYWVMDGMFFHYLQAAFDNEKNAASDFHTELKAFFDSYRID